MASSDEKRANTTSFRPEEDEIEKYNAHPTGTDIKLLGNTLEQASRTNSGVSYSVRRCVLVRLSFRSGSKKRSNLTEEPPHFLGEDSPSWVPPPALGGDRPRICRIRKINRAVT